MVGYYNNGEGPGMDATVFTPLVDFRFINNTPYHLLIENYYNEEFESLTPSSSTSTGVGRRVRKLSLSSRISFPHQPRISGSSTRRWLKG